MRANGYFVIAASLVMGVARADPRTDAHVKRAEELVTAREYAQAIAELEAAYAIEARPEILYGIAQARRLGGDCPGAIATYERLLATNPDDQLRTFARENIARCKALVGPAAPPPPAVLPRDDRQPRPLFRDPLALALVGGGLVVAATGTIIWKLGRDDTNAANRAMTYDEFDAHFHGATKQRIGVSGMVIGGALLAGGIVKRIVAPGRDDGVTVSAGVGPHHNILVAAGWTW